MAKRRGLQEINAGSMADIAFLLLIFFLVTTTMDVDSGIARKLPPMPDEEMQEDDSQINAKNIYVVLINTNNQLLVEGEANGYISTQKEQKDLSIITGLILIFRIILIKQLFLYKMIEELNTKHTYKFKMN